MKKFYPILRRICQWELLLITLLTCLYPSISKATSYNTNLVTNGDAQGSLSVWNPIISPIFVQDLPSNLGIPSSPNGNKVFDFYPGMNYPTVSNESLTQTIDVSDLSADLSAGKVKVVLTGYVYGSQAIGIARIILEQLNASNAILATSQVENSGYGSWETKTITFDNLNTSTRKLKITLYASVNAISPSADFDGIDLKLYKYPTVTTTAAASIATTSATLGGNVTADGSPANTERGVVYSISDSTPTIADGATKVAMGSGSGAFSQSVGSLTGGQLYYINAYATNAAGTVYGTPTSFTTLTPTVTTATTNTATDVTINSATLNGTVNANNYSTTVTFQYGLTTGYGTTVTANQSPVTGSTATAVSKSITGLASSTTYHFRVVAVNGTDGTKYGGDQTFTTLTPVSEIGLKQSSTAIADGGSYDFGFHQPSTNTDIIFTIENTGTGVLTLTTPISIGGTNANQFSIQSQPSSSVAVSGSTTFTVRFTPTSIGNKTATISIANNDSNENPYDLTITGAGYLPATVTTNTANYYNQHPVGIVATGMTVNGSVNANNSSTAVTFEYGLTTSYGSSATATQSPVTGISATSVDYNLTGLTPNTQYHFRAVGTNLGGTTYGSDQTFTTPIIENFVDETNETTAFTEGGTSFTVNGYLKIWNANKGYNGSTIDDYLIYNEFPFSSAGIIGSFRNALNYFYANSLWLEPGIRDELGNFIIGQYGDVIIRGKKSGSTLFTYTLLSSNTSTSNYTFIDLSGYNSILIDELEFEVTNNITYMRIDAFNFNYQPAFVPTVTTQAVSIIGTTTATGNGNITNLGSPNPTAYGVCWNTTGTPTTSDSKSDKGAASATGAFTASMTSLTANTTYYVRAYATNPAGTSYGTATSFTTLTNGTFTGTTNNDWATATNWAGGSVPTSGTDVTIPSGKSPVIGATTSSNCNNLTVTGSLTIQSSSSGTGSLIVSGTSTGTVTCQRYMTGSKWHFVSSAVSGQSIASFLGANSLISTQPSTTTRAMKNYTESTDLWSALFTNSTSGNMGGGNGHAVWPDTDGTVSFSGSLQTGTTDVSIARTPATGFGWNLVGNPYSSAIAINTAAGASNFINGNSAVLDQSYCGIYYWDGSAYVAVNLSDAAFYAQAGQGFFVKSKAGGGTVSFTPALRTHQPSAEFKNAVIPWPEIKLTASLGELANSTVIRFNDGMKRGLDPGYDAGVFKSGLDIYTRLVDDNGVDFSTQCLPLVAGSEMVVPIGFESNVQGGVALSVVINNLPSGVGLTLEDRETGMITPVAKSGQLATIPIAANPKIAGRFFFHISYLKNATGTTGIPDEWRIYVAKGQICISGPVTDGATATVYDLPGRKTGSYQLQKGSLNYIPCSDFRNGIYLISVKQKNGTFSGKIPVMNE